MCNSLLCGNTYTDSLALAFVQLPNQMISLILIFGFLCRSSIYIYIFRYPDDLRNIVQQCATVWCAAAKTDCQFYCSADTEHHCTCSETVQSALEKHYADLSSKGFFRGLVTYMASGAVCAMVGQPVLVKVFWILLSLRFGRGWTQLRLVVLCLVRPILTMCLHLDQHNYYVMFWSA